MNSKEENSEDFCLSYVLEFGLRDTTVSCNLYYCTSWNKLPEEGFTGRIFRSIVVSDVI